MAIDPSTLTALAALDFRHLPLAEKTAAQPFAELAIKLADAAQNQGPEQGANTTAAIRHLAKAQALAIANARLFYSPDDALNVVHQMRNVLGMPG